VPLLQKRGRTHRAGENRLTLEEEKAVQASGEGVEKRGKRRRHEGLSLCGTGEGS